MTKKTAIKAIDDTLQTFLNEAAERFKPDATVLQAQIQNAIQRYNLTHTTQRFHATAPLLIQQMQEMILDSWRYDIEIPQSVYIAGGTGNMSITMRKPASLIEQEISVLKRQVEDAYHNALANAMELEVDSLIQDAADEALRRTEESAAAERDAMRQRLKDMLLAGATV